MCNVTLPGIIILCIGTFLLTASVVWRAFFVEPKTIHVETHRLLVPSLRSAAPLRILQLTDLHLWTFTPLHQKVLFHAEGAQPDLIVLTGDYAESEGGLEALAILVSGLRRIAPIYAVLGDNDQEDAMWQSRLEAIFANEHVIVLRNMASLINHDGHHLLVVGVDDPNTGFSRLDHARNQALSLLGIQSAEHLMDVPNIMLAHSPEIVLQAEPWMDLIVTGHTHGGQICLPGGVALHTNTPACKGYSAGWYTISPTTRLYVNRGVGTARIPARLFCLPEMALFELVGPEGA